MSIFKNENEVRQGATGNWYTIAILDGLIPVKKIMIGASDCEFHRDAADVIGTPDSLQVDGNLTVTGALDAKTLDGYDSVDFLRKAESIELVTTRDHHLLTGLGDDDHTQYYKQYDTRVLFCGNGIEADYYNTSIDSQGVRFYRGDDSTARTNYMELDYYSTTGLRVIGANGSQQWAYINSSSGWQAGSSKKFKKNITNIKTKTLNNIIESFKTLKIKEYIRIGNPDQDDQFEVGILAEGAPSYFSDGVGISHLKFENYLLTICKYQEERINKLEQMIGVLNG